MNTPNYDILSNNYYADFFQYTSIENRKKDDHINSNLVANIIYAGEERIKKANWCYNF